MRDVVQATSLIQRIISAINHSVASSWFFFYTHMQRCTDKHTPSIKNTFFVACRISALETEITSF